MKPEKVKLETPRLVLRRYTRDDALDLCAAIGDRRIAEATLRIPHPYSITHAREFIDRAAGPIAESNLFARGVFSKETERLVGGVGLRLERLRETEGDDAGWVELGYWVAVPEWGRGYATEAVAAMTTFAFDHLKATAVCAEVFLNNPASRRVVEKIGMTPYGPEEGLESVEKDGRELPVRRLRFTRAAFMLRRSERRPA
jgi:[ribosomal protein S5]-alanine N-acetyltransferase